MMNFRIILVFVAVFISLSLFAQHQNIIISTAHDPNEPSIALDPKNPMHIVAGANLDNVYISLDGGLTWSDTTMTSSYGVWGDPVIIVDTASAFYFFHLSAPLGYGDPSWLDRIVCQKMDTIGHTWNDGSYTAPDGIKDHDKQWAAVDPRNNTIYMTWTQFDEYASTLPGDSSHIMFAKSLDAGGSWSAPLRIDHIGGDCIDEDNTVEGAVPAVGPNGEIYVAWSGPLGIMFDRSTDEGTTWLDNDIFISDQPGGWDYSIPGIMRCNGLPFTCCDISNGPYRGNIYVNWTDQRNGTNDVDVWMVKSTDGGNTWSAPKRVNDDPAGKNQFFTSMTVDQATGKLYFVFYDRRNYADKQTDVYMAVSDDGGETFINFRISESPFDPYSSVFFGDYTDVTAHNNIVRPIWIRLDHEDLAVMTAIIDSNFLGVDEKEVNEDHQALAWPNPFRESSFISFKLYAPTRVSLSVCDMQGRTVASLIDNELLPGGKYIRQFDARTSHTAAGVYFFRLVYGDKIVVRKMVLD